MTERRYASYSPPLTPGTTRANNVVIWDDVNPPPANFRLLGASEFCEPNALWNGASWERTAPTLEQNEAGGVLVGGQYVLNSPVQRDKILWAAVLDLAGGNPYPFTLQRVDGTEGTVADRPALRAVVLAFWRKFG